MTSKGNGLQFGLWYSFRNPKKWAISTVDLYQQTLAQIQWAESIGYEDVWLTEHHFCEEDEHAPSILTIASAVAAVTRTIRIGTGVLLLPLHNAVRVAEDSATIDIISGGRFELGIGVGYKPDEFDNLGVDPSHRAGLADEGLQVIRALWTGKPTSYKGLHYNLDNATLAPLPVQKNMPLWVGGFAPVAARRAARLGTGYIGTGDMTQQSKIFLEEWDKLGRNGEGELAGGHFWLIVSSDPEKTFSRVAPHVLYQIQMYNIWLGNAGQNLFPEINKLDELRELGILNCVSPQQACDMIGDYRDSTGIKRYYTWTVPPGFPVREMDEHLELFATDVIPHFR